MAETNNVDDLYTLTYTHRNHHHRRQSGLPKLPTLRLMQAEVLFDCIMPLGCHAQRGFQALSASIEVCSEIDLITACSDLGNK